MSSDNMNYIAEIAAEDVSTLEIKDQSYGSSWKKRGGVGAFMMLARKWDRLENQCKAKGFDIFGTIERDGSLDKSCLDVSDGVLDDIRDLRAYLLLVESETMAQHPDHPVALHRFTANETDEDDDTPSARHIHPG